MAGEWKSPAFLDYLDMKMCFSTSTDIAVLASAVNVEGCHGIASTR